MTDETPPTDVTPTPPAADTVTPVTEPVTPPAPTPEGDIPAWGQQLTDTVNTLAETLKAAIPSTPQVTDETPVSVPWTHWSPFKR